MNYVETTQARPHYRLLDEQQIQQLHAATLELLETAGIRVLQPEALQLLKNAGAQVKDGNVALLPGGLVEDCIHSAPSAVTIYNRLGEPAMRLAGRNVHYGLGTDLINTAQPISAVDNSSTRD